MCLCTDVSTGNVQAISLQDICFGALGKVPKARSVRRKDMTWENLKKTNLSSFIRIYRYALSAGPATFIGTPCKDVEQPLGYAGC